MKIKSWDDVDNCLGLIASYQRQIAGYKGQADALKATIAELEPRIEAFVREHEDELQERSKSLVHGRVWLRQATRLVAKSWAKVLDKIRDWHRRELLRVKEEPDKTALALLDDAELKALGVVRKTEDTFGYEAA